MTDITITTATNVLYNGSTYQFIDPHTVTDLITELNDLTDRKNQINDQLAVVANLAALSSQVQSDIDEVTSSIAMLCVDANKVA